MRALNGQKTGTVLWVSDRDKNGIIKDDNGNEIYFDISVCKNRILPIRGQMLKFDINETIKDCLCAKNISDLLG